MKRGPKEINVEKEVVIITRYFLPNINVDSDAVYHMIQGLRKTDGTVKIHVVTTESKYKTDIIDDGKYSLEALKDVKIHRIKSVLTNPSSSLGKLFSDLVEGYRLVLRAKKLKIVNIISLSNPPLISLWHSLLLSRYNFYYWSFDIFPQAFVSDKILTNRSIIYRIIKKLTYLNAPKSLIALGENQYTFLKQTYNKDINKIILPCGIHNEELKTSQDLPFWKDPNLITIGYLGNLGRAHSIAFLKNVIICIARKPGFKLILSVYGHHQKELVEHINVIKSDNIILVDFIEKSQLGLIDVHLVSLMESWSNISVPSKAVSAVCSGGVLWYCGPANVDTWSMFEKCSFKTSDQEKSIVECLDKMTPELVSSKKVEAISLKKDLLLKEKLAYKSIVDLLQ